MTLIEWNTNPNPPWPDLWPLTPHPIPPGISTHCRWLIKKKKHHPFFWGISKQRIYFWPNRLAVIISYNHRKFLEVTPNCKTYTTSCRASSDFWAFCHHNIAVTVDRRTRRAWGLLREVFRSMLLQQCFSVGEREEYLYFETLPWRRASEPLRPPNRVLPCLSSALQWYLNWVGVQKHAWNADVPIIDVAEMLSNHNACFILFFFYFWKPDSSQRAQDCWKL